MDTRVEMWCRVWLEASPAGVTPEIVRADAEIAAAGPLLMDAQAASC